jgi:P-type Ca2+ transporter type 2C
VSVLEVFIASHRSVPPVSPHRLAPEEVAAHLDVRPHVGLTGAHTERRTAQYGPNHLPEAPTRSARRVLFGQFQSILILILIGAALMGNVKDAVIILAVVVINAVVGFSQGYRAEQSGAALKDMLPVKARVRREGGMQEIPAEDLVPGDVVLLEAGDRLPANGRLSMVAGLEIDESTLIGELQPVGKHTVALAPLVAPAGVGGWRFGNAIDGCRAEYMFMPHAMANLMPVPDELSDEDEAVCHCGYGHFS